MRSAALLLLAAAGGAVSCSSALRPFSQQHVEMRVYRPLEVPATTSVHERWVRLGRLAAEEGWRLETFDETRGLMIASRASKDTADLRERLRIVLLPDATEIGVQTEVLEDGEWDSRDLTSGSYEYARETAIGMTLDGAGSAGPRR